MQEAVRRARQLVGVPFRTQGRRPEHGLDCVGLVTLVHELPGGAIPRDYRLRGSHLACAEKVLLEFYEHTALADLRVGDLLLLHCGAEQIHFAVHCGDTFIHADAALRRIVEVPGPPPWPMLGVYRRRGQ